MESESIKGHRCECKKSVLCMDCIEQSIDPLQKKKTKKTEEQESEEKITLSRKI